jgi:hypothetical protein
MYPVSCEIAARRVWKPAIGSPGTLAGFTPHGMRHHPDMLPQDLNAADIMGYNAPWREF